MWSWLSFMNPHRLCWGFALGMPFAYVVALATMLSILINKGDKKLPWTRESILLAVFVIWMFITTFYAINQEGAWLQWNKVWKIQLIAFLTMMVLKDIRQIHLLVLTIALSLGFYGAKGGVFTLLHGGGERVWGPDGTFIAGNNEIGLALNMTIPLLWYLKMYSQKPWLKKLMLGVMCLSVISVFGSQSRGAMVGLAAMGSIFVLKGKNRILYGVMAILGGLAMYQFMPESWHERMGTMKTYDKDGSVTGRFNAWGFAYNLAKTHFFGGGFEAFTPDLFRIYAPTPEDFHDAHSIYFEVLGEHGFVGLTLFVALGIATWRAAVSIIKEAERYPEFKQLADLVRMVQVSLVGYAVSGLFLGMAYFDFYYALIAIVVASTYVLRKHVGELGKNPSAPVSLTMASPEKPKTRSLVRKYKPTG